jgi:hypothetical protein
MACFDWKDENTFPHLTIQLFFEVIFAANIALNFITEYQDLTIDGET